MNECRVNASPSNGTQEKEWNSVSDRSRAVTLRVISSHSSHTAVCDEWLEITLNVTALDRSETEFHSFSCVPLLGLALTRHSFIREFIAWLLYAAVYLLNDSRESFNRYTAAYNNQAINSRMNECRVNASPSNGTQEKEWNSVSDRSRAVTLRVISSHSSHTAVCDEWLEITLNVTALDRSETEFHSFSCVPLLGLALTRHSFIREFIAWLLYAAVYLLNDSLT